MPKKKGRIPVKEYSPPPSDSDSEPDSEALMRRRRREGFPFPEAVSLLEKFLKGAEEKIEETHKLYTRPGKALTMEEISSLDRKVLGVSAIIRRVGDRMKKLEEESWKEMEEILEGGRRENDRDGKKLSYLLAVQQPSRDVTSLTDFLKTNEFPFKIEPTFKDLAPFAKSFSIKEEETTEVQEKETEDHVGGNPVQLASGGSQKNEPPRLKQHKETSEEHAVTSHPKVQTKKLEPKQLAKGHNKDADDREVKKEVKEEVDEGRNIRSRDHQAEVEKEASKRKEKEVSRKEGAPEDVAKEKSGKSKEVVVKEEEVDDAVPSQEPTVEREMDGGGWKRGTNLPIHAAKPKRRPSGPASTEDTEFGQSDSAKRRKAAESEDEEDTSGREEDDYEEPLDGMIGDDFGGMDSNVNDTESPVEKPEGRAMTAQPKDQRKKVEQKQLERGRNRDIDDREVKKEVKEEVDEGGNVRSKDHQAGIGKEASKRKKQEKSRKESAPDDVGKFNNGKPNEVVLKEEEVEYAVPPQEPTVEREMDRGGWQTGTKFPIHAKPKRGPSDTATTEDTEVSQNESAKRRKNVESEDEEDTSGREEDDHQGNEPLDGMIDCDFGGMDSDVNEEESPVKKTKRTRKEKGKDVGDSDGGGEDRGAKIENRRRSCRMTKSVKYAVERESDDESSDEDGGDSSDSEEEERQRKVMRRSRRGGYDQGASEEEQEEDEMEETVDRNGSLLSGEDQPVDKDDSVLMTKRKCPVDGCQETVSSSKDLPGHLRNHTTPMICGVCKRSCPSDSHLIIHYRMHTGEKPFKCDTCKKGFPQKHKLHIHQRAHTGERPFKCDVCEHRTVTSSNMKKHQWIHTDERPYSCTVCNYRTTTSSILTSHMRTHTGERPYECDVCGYKATYPHILKAHKRVHTGEKPYSCTCGFKTAQLSNLKSHKKNRSH